MLSSRKALINEKYVINSNPVLDSNINKNKIYMNVTAVANENDKDNTPKITNYDSKLKPSVTESLIWVF